MPKQVAVNDDGLTFDEWLAEVDAVIGRKIGLTSADLADFPSWDLWHDGVSPADGAAECVERDDTFGDLAGLFD